MAKKPKKLFTFIARGNIGDLYYLTAESKDAAYRLFGRVVFSMEDADEPGFDTGNVDIDLVQLLDLKPGQVVRILQD